jgi:transcriptional regulator with XRE-family HTH domain
MTGTVKPQKTLSDLVADRLRQIRAGRGWSAARLADECNKAGYPQLTESVIANIETGRRDQHGRRRREVTIDELAAFCMTLKLPLSSLLGGEWTEVDERHLAWLESVAEEMETVYQQVERITNALHERGFGPPPDQEGT